MLPLEDNQTEKREKPRKTQIENINNIV